MIEQMTLIQPMKLWEPVEGLRSPEPAEKGRDGAEKSEGTLFSSILATAIQQVYDTSAEVGEKQYLLATGQLDDAHSLPIAQAKAGISIDLLVALRNKALESYNELLKMNI